MLHNKFTITNGIICIYHITTDFALHSEQKNNSALSETKKERLQEHQKIL